MKINKNAKLLSQATVGDLTERKCGFCGLNLIFSEVDHEEKIAWISCPTFIAEREFSKDEHSSYSVPLADTGYHDGDETKPHRLLKEPAETDRSHHDRPNTTAPPKAIGESFKFTSASEKKRDTKRV